MVRYIFSNYFKFLKKKRRVMEECDDEFFESLAKKRRYDDMEGYENSRACATAVASIASDEKERKERAKDKCRDTAKLWWEDVYSNWKEENFKSKVSINCETFNFVLNEIHDDIVMSLTNLKPSPTTPDRQLAMTLYRFATGCIYSTLSDLFGVSVSVANNFFNKAC